LDFTIRYSKPFPAGFSPQLPASLPYYLMFSHKDDHSRFMHKNDGSVELASELDCT
jgi:hypothetical protein